MVNRQIHMHDVEMVSKCYLCTMILTWLNCQGSVGPCLLLAVIGAWYEKGIEEAVK